PIDFENGALVLETVRGMIRADRQCLNEDLLKIQMRAGGALPVTREKALLAERRVQLELLREEIRRDLDRLNQETADREPQAAPSKNAKSEGAKPGPTKTRGTFMGLRRWLGG
ncbi:MAG: hypothetical protein JNM56_30615, partial [Planctomycetia bacterium]|nr:hypothetical protein [Planctomycetia bacterium]